MEPRNEYAYPLALYHGSNLRDIRTDMGLLHG